VLSKAIASPRRYVLTVLVTLSVITSILLCSSAAALAEEARPGWEATGRFGPSELHPGGYGALFLYVFNGGSGSATGRAPVLVDKLPKGFEAVSEVPIGPESDGAQESGGCTGTSEVTCRLSGALPLGEPEIITIPVRVLSEAPPAVGEPAPVDLVSVTGGGALGVTRTRIPALVTAGSGFAPLGFSGFDAWLSNADGTTDTQAGSHPYALTVEFSPNSQGLGASEEVPTVGEMHALNVNLPPGLVGEPGATPKCTRQQVDNAEQNGEEGECPLSSQVGWDYATVSGNGLLKFPIYNMVPPPGVAAQFAFSFNGTSTFLDSGVRSGGDNGITTHVNPLTQRRIVFNEATFWGFPGKVQAEQKGEYGTTGVFGKTASELAQEGQRPLLTLPTSCQGPQEFSLEEIGTWQEEDAIAHENDPLFKAQTSLKTHNDADEEVGFTGCERLVHFQPSLEAAPDTSDTDSPAGLTATVRVPQNINPEGLATAGLHATTVVLPEGMVINPGQATGLQACQSDQDGLGLAENGEVNEGPPSCPAASKVGTDEIVTPLLPDKLQGSVYVLQSNPPEVKLLVAASGDGINIKQVGTVHLNEATGQLTTTFASIPDAPFSEFKLSFSGGAQAALVTPPKCGVFSTTTSFTPWSAPFVAEAFDSTLFAITAGPGGGACTSPMGFAPTLTAGSTTDQAGGYTDFSMLLSRGDGQQRFSSLSFKAPEGLSGMIASVPLCGEQQANEGTCPAASQIGHTVVGAGPGPYPFYIPQQNAPPTPIYLTGPYDGAPFGLSIVTPVVAGPFNLGTNVVRARIEVDPHTAQITITTDVSGPHSIPTILDGIPTDVRSINAIIDRPRFMFNPTSCSPQEFSGTAYSDEGAKAGISSHFQMGSCQSLKFAPNFKVSTVGKASKAQGASLTAKIVYPTGALGANQASSQSNIASVKVDLPRQLPSRLTTLQKACTNAQFEANPASCPAASVVGRARVLTPILPVPLEGPAFFVSHGGEAFPSLEVMLQGYGVTVELVGSTFISKAGITSSTFKSTPDVPFSSFELTLPRGKYSALAANVPAKANYSLCGQKLTMPTAFTAQDGAVIHQSTPIAVAGCPKVKKKAAKKPKRAKKSGRRNGGKGGK
jgi:hypothetical protein